MQPLSDITGVSKHGKMTKLPELPHIVAFQGVTK